MKKILQRRGGISFLLVLSILAGTGCYGPFSLTNDVYTWNCKTGSKWSNELVFLAFVIIPVYGVTLLVDGIVLNSIEFWSSSGGTASSQLPTAPPGDAALLEAYRDCVSPRVLAAQPLLHTDGS